MQLFGQALRRRDLWRGRKGGSNDARRRLGSFPCYSSRRRVRRRLEPERIAKIIGDTRPGEVLYHSRWLLPALPEFPMPRILILAAALAFFPIRASAVDVIVLLTPKCALDPKTIDLSNKTGTFTYYNLCNEARAAEFA